MTKKLVRNLIFFIIIIVFTSIVIVYNNTKNNEKENNFPKGEKNTPEIEETTLPTNSITASPEVIPTFVPEPTEEIKEKKKVKARALFLSGWTMGSADNLDHYTKLANETEINSYVIDIKGDGGILSYESQIPLVKEINSWENKFYPEKVITQLHDNDIYVIGRIVCFKDPILSSKRPDLAIKNSSGGLFFKNGITWLNPYNKDSWVYLVDIAKEAIELGFDEIQFDYIRFPAGGEKSGMYFGDVEKKKYEIINEFLAYAREEMPDAVLSADVFGIILESPKDTEHIGQYLELIGKDIDYICPMLYPSHYARGQVVNEVRFSKPDLDPYGVVYNTLMKAKKRLQEVDDYQAEMRPYLQDFTASWIGSGNYMRYGAEQVRQQIKAVYDAGYEEWILWDASNTYSESAFKKEGE